MSDSKNIEEVIRKYWKSALDVSETELRNEAPTEAENKSGS